jgi:hypothetical protein
MEQLNSFSLNDDFWIRFQEHCISFRYKKLPIDVHFTIAFNSNSPDINLHISKNTASQNNKPKIEILRIKKQILIEDAEILASKIFHAIFEKIGDSFEENGVYYLPINQNDAKKQKIVSNKLKDKFQDIIRIKQKKRLKIDGDIKNKLQEFSEDKDIQKKILEDIIELTQEQNSNLEAGIILNNKGETPIINFYGNFYRIRILSETELLGIFLSPNIVNSFFQKVEDAIKLIDTLETWEDAKLYNDPFILERQINIINDK